MKEFSSWYAQNKEKAFEDFFSYLRFKSISTESEYKSEMLNCAQFLIDYLKTMGMEASLHETTGYPFVFGEKKGNNGPTLLIYLHYDVQPVDPIELWESDPFTPTLRDNKIVARGATDDKGQGFYTLLAIRAYLEMAQISNFNLKVIIEGEEEIGSGGLTEALPKYTEMLKADAIIMVDSWLESLEQPSITMGMRGIATFDLECTVAKTDMHSGDLGGIAPNSAKILVNVLSKIYGDDSKILLENFYDDVIEVSDDERQTYLKREMNQEQLKKAFGLEAFAQEPGCSLVESGSLRPTFEINGIYGGYAGDGFKTVIPAKSIAKLSFRTVPNQSPERIEKMLHTHLEKHMPKGVEWKLTGHGHGKYTRSKPGSQIADICMQAYSEVFGKECQPRLLGGSIPVAADLKEACGDAELIALGTATMDTQCHAPNEFIYVESFEKGFLTIIRILDILENKKS